MATPAAEPLSRRGFLAVALGSAALATRPVAANPVTIQRPIPSSGESIPVIGLGTWRTLDVGPGASERAPLRDVLREFVNLGGRLVDSSPMYGRAEQVVADLAVELGIHKRLFLATKVWTSGRDAGVRQMLESSRRLRTDRLDLIQVHNLLDWRTHLATLRRWKEQGTVRYLGVTQYTEGAHDELTRVLQAETVDFVQVNYSIAERGAERRILPVAAERRVAVIANRPFAEAQLFSRVRGKALPPWAAEIGCASWAQFFLKFVVSHPAVTCAIPATAKVTHLVDNMQAGVGPLPDEPMRARMARVVADL